MYTFRMVPAISFAPFVAGSGASTAPRQDILRVGTFTVGSSCLVTGHTIATTDDGLTTVVIDFTWTGTVTLNVAGDGTGKLSVTPSAIAPTQCTPTNASCSTFEGAETYAFVAGGGGSGNSKSLELIETDNLGGGAKIFMTGTAQRKGGDN